MQKNLKSSQAYSTTLGILVILITVLIVTPEVQAYSGSFSESFNDNDFIDESMTNVTGLTTGEVSIPHQDIVLVGSEPYISDYGADDILVVGDIAYVMGNNDGLLLFDISNVSDPEYLSMEDTGLANSYTGTLAYEDGVIYYPAQNSLDIINVTDSENPQLLTSLEFTSVRDVYVQDSVAFVGANLDGLVMLDVSDPTTPTSIANYTDIDTWAVSSVYVVGNYAFISLGNSYDIVNITDIYNPTRVSRISYVGSGVSSFVVHDDYLLSTVGIFDVSNVSDPVRISDSPIYDKVVFQSNIMFAAQYNLGIYDFSDPENLQLLYVGPEARSIEVVGDYLVTVGTDNVLSIYRYRDGTEYWNLYKPYAEAQSETIETIDPNVYDGVITDVTLTVNATTPTNTDITYYASARNGSFWNEIVPGAQTSLDLSGENLKWRIEMSTTDPSVTPSLRSIGISYTVLLRPPLALTPVGSSTVNRSYPTFTWQEIEGAESYNLQVDTTQTFDSVNLISETLEISDLTEDQGILSYGFTEELADGDWYWRVAAVDDGGQIGIYSPFIPFSVDAGADPTGTGGFDLAALMPYILAAGGVIVLVAIVVIIRKRGS